MPEGFWTVVIGVLVIGVIGAVILALAQNYAIVIPIIIAIIALIFFMRSRRRARNRV